jgi:hypothetical protein
MGIGGCASVAKKAGSYSRRMLSPSQGRVQLSREMLMQTHRVPDAVAHTDCYTKGVKQIFYFCNSRLLI